MEEDEYRSTYASINQQRCVFEKAINARRCGCSKSRRFLLAGREGVGCECKECLQLCSQILDEIRSRARFSLQLTQVHGVLPHNKEIRVQVGGMQGLRDATFADHSGKLKVDDISAVITGAMEKYTDIASLPYSEVIKSVAACEGRRKRTYQDKR